MASHNATPILKLPVSQRDHVLGPEDAAVTLVEYGDYQCVHCRQVQPMIQELRSQFGDRLRYVFRHFPLSHTHPDAQLAAEAAEAAAAQGKFWEMHNYLLEHQEVLKRQDLVRYAAVIGLDTRHFEHELQTGVYSGRVREDIVSGTDSGAVGTPTFFINGERYDRAWDLDSLTAEIEKPLGVRVRVMFGQFSRLQAAGGIVLLLGTVLAILWANSAWREGYSHLWETHLEIILGNLKLSESLLHWVNDGLMVIFFFVVGLEIKREILIGELASVKRAALPLMAAIGGMLFPAAIFALLNWGGEGAVGWGIPMATDIAFMLGLLTLLGRRVPLSLKVFFTALAIADDLGAVLVIALFYSGEIVWAALVVAAILLAVLIVLNRGQVRSPLPYGIVGIGLWLAFLRSGIHPTIAGVLLAMTIPARTTVRAEAFLAQCTAALGGLAPTEMGGNAPAADGRQQGAAQSLEVIAERIQSPLQRLERNLNPWVAYAILPVFAFANAGVHLPGNLLETLTSPLALGIIFGLVVGKPLGITLLSWSVVRLGIAEMPYGVSWRQLFCASWMAGIGFTMSLFIADSAFDRPLLLSMAKIATLLASVIAGGIGFALTGLISDPEGRMTSKETAD